MIHRDMICSECGSDDIDILDRTGSDLGYHAVCNNCFNSEYSKALDEFNTFEYSNISLYDTESKNKHLDRRVTPRLGKNSTRAYRRYKNRTRAYRRYKNRAKAERKRKISKIRYSSDIYNNINQYSKNKVHCSCGLCSCKTRSLWGYRPRVSEIRRFMHGET